MSSQLIIIFSLATAFFLWLLTVVPGNLLSGLSLIVFFLPFERIPSYDIAGETLKINHILGFILIFFWLINRIYYRQKIVEKNIILLPALFLTASMILSIVGAELKVRALIFSLISIFTIFLAVITVDLVRSKFDLSTIEKAIIASAWVVVIFSLWQFLGDLAGLPYFLTGLVPGYSKLTFGFPRIQAFSKEPLYLGNYLFIPLSVVTGKILAGSKKASLWLLFVGLLVVMFLTLSRGAIIGLVAGLVVLAILMPKKILSVRVILPSLLVIILAGAGFFTGLNLINDTAKDRFVNQLLVRDLNQSESTVSRLSSVNIALSAFQEHPILGIGMGNYGGYTVGYDDSSEKVQDIVNNEYLELLAETGILGFSSFILILVVTISLLLRAARFSYSPELKLMSASWLAGLTGIIVQYNFLSTLAIIHIWIAIGLALATAQIALKEKNV